MHPDHKHPDPCSNFEQAYSDRREWHAHWIVKKPDTSTSGKASSVEKAIKMDNCLS